MVESLGSGTRSIYGKYGLLFLPPTSPLSFLPPSFTRLGVHLIKPNFERIPESHAAVIKIDAAYPFLSSPVVLSHDTQHHKQDVVIYTHTQ